MKIVDQSVECITSTPNALQVIEGAGRTCYKSEEKITSDSAVPFVRGIVKRGHESVLEHASATFRIVTDRGVSHEIVRHRLASYSQESTRYCNYGSRDGEISVIEPPGLNSAMRLGWEMSCKTAESAYITMIKSSVPPQIARSVLPTCLKTEIVMTANFREWRHFIRLRTSIAAHPQIRVIAGMVLFWFLANYPVIVEDIPSDGKTDTKC